MVDIGQLPPLPRPEWDSASGTALQGEAANEPFYSPRHSTLPLHSKQCIMCSNKLAIMASAGAHPSRRELGKKKRRDFVALNLALDGLLDALRGGSAYPRSRGAELVSGISEGGDAALAGRGAAASLPPCRLFGFPRPKHRSHVCLCEVCFASPSAPVWLDRAVFHARWRAA